ncbi:SEL1-like repeat protein [Novosphingobium sp. TH158]|uniref:tetratricopeptide repeat protein n=1 Tax=Novosphingobium sp. TH158 TaxID=2067455 RepID=UPI000C7DED87|nr:SEL1-like repeat protein [Novosphingobium sp. TH158]PLK27572.1 hypothetical protein C0V78_12245 [Novosphingobium sp. TH158]
MRGSFRKSIAGLLAAAALFALPASATAQEREPTPSEKAALERAGDAQKRKDFVAVRAILAEPALAQFARAHFVLGQLHEQGMGGAKDPAAARASFRRAAELGDIQAMLKIGEELERENAPALKAEAKSWFTAAANRNYPFYSGHARAHLGRMLWQEGDAAGAVTQWSRTDDPFARACLGMAYQTGKGTGTDLLRADYAFYKMGGQRLGEGGPCVELAANAGNLRAQYLVGLAYDDKQSKAFNPAEAVKWYRKAADGGLTIAAQRLADKLDDGEGVPRDAATAYRYYAKVAQATDIGKYDREEAWVRMGEMALAGDGVPKNVADAVRFLSQAEYGDHNYQLGLLYAGAEGFPRDMTKAVQAMSRVSDEKEAQAKAWLKQQADAGNALAQYTYASETQYDRAPTKDAKGKELTSDQQDAIERRYSQQARDFYRKAARQSLLQAMYKVADSDSEISDAERLRLMRSAAERGYPSAMVELARWHFLGWHGLAKDEGMERSWLDRAAATRDPWATGAAAEVYHLRGALGTNYMGSNPTKIAEVLGHYRLAARYYEMAHAAGSESAAGQLASIYSRTSPPGLGNPQLAFKWRKIAVEKQPDQKSMVELSQLYETGKGTPVDLMRAWFWAKSAMRYGTSKDGARVDALWKRLTPAQQATGERAIMTCELTDYQTCRL